MLAYGAKFFICQCRENIYNMYMPKGLTKKEKKQLEEKLQKLLQEYKDTVSKGSN